MLLEFDPSNEKQRDALYLWEDDVTEEIVYGGAKNSGKSYLGVNCIFHDALVYPETLYFIAREELNDLRKYTIPSIQKVFHDWKIDIRDYAKFNGQDNFFNCYNGSKVFLLDCAFQPQDPMYERFGSMQMTRGWIEEGGEIAELAKINLGLSIGRWRNDQYNLLRKLLITCNPKKNWIKYHYIDPFRSGTLPADKGVVLGTVYNNVFREKGSEKVLEGLTGVARQRLLQGNWDYDSDADALIRSEKIVDLYTNTYVQGGEKFITADIARFGSDKTVIWIWDGLRIIGCLVMKGARTTEVAYKIAGLAGKYYVPLSNIIVDEDGVGGGVVDQLGCRGFVNNSRPLETGLTNNINKYIPDNFDNLKSQCYYLLAEKINLGQIVVAVKLDEIFDGESNVKVMLNQELENVRVKEMDSDKKQGVLPKAKVKENIGRSPDYSDGMMMRMYFELQPQFQVLAW